MTHLKHRRAAGMAKQVAVPLALGIHDNFNPLT
jgi:hypothetical protein